jgi:hypothetical protein
MVFFAHGAFGWENGLTVMATVKTATSRMVQAGCFIDDIFPHLNTLEIQQQNALASSSVCAGYLARINSSTSLTNAARCLSSPP